MAARAWQLQRRARVVRPTGLAAAVPRVINVLVLPSNNPLDAGVTLRGGCGVKDAESLAALSDPDVIAGSVGLGHVVAMPRPPRVRVVGRLECSVSELGITVRAPGEQRDRVAPRNRRALAVPAVSDVDLDKRWPGRELAIENLQHTARRRRCVVVRCGLASCAARPFGQGRCRQEGAELSDYGGEQTMGVWRVYYLVGSFIRVDVPCKDHVDVVGVEQRLEERHDLDLLSLASVV
jgi:hypothetical protein